MTTPIKNWIDIVSSHHYFNLIAPNLENEIEMADDLEGGAEGIITKYNRLYKTITVPEDFPGVPPTYMGATSSHSYVNENGVPHAEEPSAAQVAGNVCFLWDKGPPRYHVGPRNVTHPLSQHREDGFPALIELVGLRKHYHNGELHRKGGHPALKCDYVFAHWFQHGKLKRSDGPTKIMIWDYKEFWTHGQFNGYKKFKHKCIWEVLPPTQGEEEFEERAAKTLEFLNKLKGGVNIFGNTFFENPEDEFCYIAEFGS